MYHSARISNSKPLCLRHLSTAIIHIPKTNIYPFGGSLTSQPVLRDVSWTVHSNESWAVVGSISGEKLSLFKTLCGRLRLIPPPPPPGMFPSFPSGLPDEISMVAFSHRPAASGDFYNYSARYGAVRGDDRVTLRQSMFPETIPLLNLPKEIEDLHILSSDQPTFTRSYQDLQLFEQLIRQVDLEEYLDLPYIALSNGQTRRARIVRAILKHPRLLLLDEPLTGLDAEHRPAMLELLHRLHEHRSPTIILGMRTQDPIPRWITHLAFVHGGQLKTGSKEEILNSQIQHFSGPNPPSKSTPTPLHLRKPIVADVRNVSVQYGDRKVLKDITWEIRQGDRWHLQGANGSGKTTLLAILTGDHPQSYTQRGENRFLKLFTKPRSALPTPYLQSLIGLVSPEIFDAFPRRGMTVWEVIGTGFDGGFVSKGENGVGVGTGLEKKPLSEDNILWRISRCNTVLKSLGPAAWCKSWEAIHEEDSRVDPQPKPQSTEVFHNQIFASLSLGEQRMVLLMRALVGQPPLVFLDEVWSGMDEGMVRTAKEYLRSDAFTPKQAVVVISHWEEEVPWTPEEGLQQYILSGGSGQVVCH